MADPEIFMTEMYDEGVVTEVIRPAAVVPEESARDILVELALRDVQNGGLWLSDPSRWARYDGPWVGLGQPGAAQLIGTIQVAYGTPTRYEITIYRATVTRHGTELGWTVTQALRRGARLRRPRPRHLPARLARRRRPSRSTSSPASVPRATRRSDPGSEPAQADEDRDQHRAQHQHGHREDDRAVPDPGDHPRP